MAVPTMKAGRSRYLGASFIIGIKSTSAKRIVGPSLGDAERVSDLGG